MWWVLTRNAESQTDIDKVKAQLWRPPPGQEPTTGPWSPQAEMGAFNALKKGLGK